MGSLEIVFLSQWLIFSCLLVVFLLLTRWTVGTLREYAGYGLGWLVALFFILVYASLGGGIDQTRANEVFLNGFHVFISTVVGVLAGVGVLVAYRFGTQNARTLALQISVYTALNLILLFLLVVEGPIAQRMIGIFSLALGIVALFGLVMFPSQAREQEINLRSAGGTQGSRPIDPGTGGGGVQNGNAPNNGRARNRLKDMRDDLQQRDIRRQ